MTNQSKIAIITLAVLGLAALGAFWYLSPMSGGVCSTPGQIAKASDGSMLACQDGAQWKPAK
jgi:hypothetical protein